MSSKTLNLYPIDYPFETLVSRFDSKKLILNPEFQRKYKWDKEGWERASKFIESCLMRIPLPSCYFAEDKDGLHVVIDGVQRITTIVKFLNNEFALEALTTFKELEGKKFSQLGEYRAELEATTIRCIVLRKENDQGLIREIFSRLNQGAVSLSDQEIRHALYYGEFDNLLVKLAKLPAISNFGKGPSSSVVKNNRESEEQVLRYFALQGDLAGYGGLLAKYLDEFMLANATATKTQCKKLEDSFTHSLNNCITVFDKDAFRDTSKKTSRQSMVYYDLLMPSLGEMTEAKVKASKPKIKAAFTALCKSEAFQKTLSGGLQNKSSILKRREIWKSLLKDNLK
jgi:Protein of unknown function DUF262